MAGPGDQVVLITGCSSGIGSALAQQFASAGYRVVATARRKGSIEARAGASQVGSMPADEFARLVVDAVTSDSPSAIVRAGKHSVRLPLISRLPAGVRDRIFSRRFGLKRSSN